MKQLHLRHAGFSEVAYKAGWRTACPEWLVVGVKSPQKDPYIVENRRVHNTTDLGQKKYFVQVEPVYSVDSRYIYYDERQVLQSHIGCTERG